MSRPSEVRWLLLMHQIPPKPNYLRVKIWRRLQRLGAVAIKNSVYVLPRTEQAQEDFQWVLREIVSSGGEASICEARFVEGLSDEQVEALFHAAREADYRQVAEEARRLTREVPAEVDDERRARRVTELARLRQRLDEVASIDFLNAPGREIAEGLLSGLEARLLAPAAHPAPASAKPARGGARGRIWVTRQGVHVDRMASAWLIRRFIDPDATFRFVSGKVYAPGPDEIRFDMFEAEFTHEGDRCTFEVLLDRFDLDEEPLRLIAAIIHDIDLKDAKFGRPESPGIEHLIAGITMTHREDDARLLRGAALFDDLYEYFRSTSRGAEEYASERR